MQRSIRYSLTVFAALLVSDTCPASAPSLVNFQGQLRDSTGAVVSPGTKSFTFRLYDSFTGGTNLWEEDQTLTIGDNGLFVAALGVNTPLTAAEFNGPIRFLEIEVESNILPRVQMVTGPYAHRVSTVDLASGGIIVGNTVIENSADPDDNMSFSVEDPNIALEMRSGGSNLSPYIDFSNDNASDYDARIQLTADGVLGVDAELDVSGMSNKIRFHYLDFGDLPDPTTYHGMFAHVHNDAKAYYAHAGAWVPLANETHSHLVTTTDIVDGTITDADVNSSAGIAPGKILGTAATLGATQTLTGDNTFTGTTVFSDSSLRVTSTGVRIGDPEAPSSAVVLQVERRMSSASGVFGLYTILENAGAGSASGMQSLTSAGPTAPVVRGLYAQGRADNATRFGVTGEALTFGVITGTSVGVQGTGSGGTTNVGVEGAAGGTGTKYGVLGSASGAGTNFAGYFMGALHCTGTLTKGAGAFKIDHPVDPENKYLWHSFVESPDMMNIYNGNVVTDAGGRVTVELPSYFSALNRDFRYQLTVIGQFAQAIVEREIEGNSFVIASDRPGVKVSWQVTGVRKDPYAEAHRIPVEENKSADERRRYLHPLELGKTQETGVAYELTAVRANLNPE